MRFIIPETKVDHICVIDATDGSDLVDFIPEIRRAILTPKFSTVVICRKSKNLSESFEKCAGEIKRGSIGINFERNKCDILNNCTELLSRENPCEVLDTLFGEDVYKFHKLLIELGNPDSEIRYTDGSGNRILHVDYSDTWRRSIRAHIPFNLSVTMALKGNGTDIADCNEEAFNFKPDKNVQNFGHWTVKPEHRVFEEKIYTAQCGDIVFMRTRTTPEGYLPSLHRSTYRERDGDPQTGLKVIGFLEPS